MNQANTTTLTRIGDHSLYVRKYGKDGTLPIILIHGIGTSSEYFIPYAKALAANFTVYALDLPGYGKASKPSSPLTIKELANVVVAFITKNDLHNCIAVGQSMGCQIVAHAVVDAQNLFSKTVLLAPTINKKERSLGIQAFRLIQDIFLESWAANMLILRNYMRMGVRRYFITTRFMMRDPIEESLRQIAMPILIMRGEKDHVVPHDWVTYLASISQKAVVADLPNAPHLLHLDSPDEVARITRDFIHSK